MSHCFRFEIKISSLTIQCLHFVISEHLSLAYILPILYSSMMHWAMNLITLY